MNGMRALLLLPLVLLAVACGAAEPEGAETGEPSATPPPLEVGAPLLYETNTTVLEDATTGPRLCLGGVASSLPPQCGGVQITNWSWDAVTGEETAGEGTWGEFHVVGTYDGEVFTVTAAGPVEPIAPVREVEDSKDKPACDEPPGGWVVPARGRTTDEDAGDVGAWATGRPEYVADWVTYVDPNAGEKYSAGEIGPFPVIYSLVVDRDAADVEAEARKRWDGPLCVVERDLPTAGRGGRHPRRGRGEPGGVRAQRWSDRRKVSSARRPRSTSSPIPAARARRSWTSGSATA